MTRSGPSVSLVFVLNRIESALDCSGHMTKSLKSYEMKVIDPL